MLLAASLALAAVSLLYPASPSYDPWAWIVWGREIAELDLNTQSGPSWKPLPILFTTVFSFLGDAGPALWLVVARAGGFFAVAMAFRIAARVAPDMKVVAGLVAAIGVLLIADFWSLVARGWSEPLLAALVLLAVDRHLDGARRAAFILLFGAALIRPEMWPFFGLYGVYVWRRDRMGRYLVLSLVALVPVLWFGPDLVASSDVLRSQARAQEPLPGRPGLFEDPAAEVLRQGRELVLTPLQGLAAVAFASAVVAFMHKRREGATLALALACVTWVGIVAAMAEAGYTGNPRYLVPAAVFVCVLAGVGAARTAQAAGFAVERLAKRPIAARGARLATCLAVAAVLVPSAIPAVDRIRVDADGVRSEAELDADLDDAVRLAGGRERVLACGEVFTGPFELPVVAWTLHIHMSDVATRPTPPGVVFQVRPAGAASSLAPDPPFDLRARTRRWDVFAACRR